MKALKDLYNGIMNDHSIQRYSTGWQDIVLKLEKRYKGIPRTDIQFDNSLLHAAAKVAKGNLLRDIESFSRELQINIETLNDKYKQGNKLGTQRSPFGIGS